MQDPGKWENIEQETLRLEIDILGIGSDVLNTRNGKVYYSSSKDTQRRYGVAIILSKEITKSATGFIPISRKIMMIQLMTNHGQLNLMPIYAQISNKKEEEIETFDKGFQITFNFTDLET